MFNNCFITAASCALARASLFTGHYPHSTGILKNADPWQHGWIEDLQRGGYQTINLGKMHTWPFLTPMGFDQRYVVENKDRYLEGRYFYDEWDKALRARGLVKQQRELYRQWPDYKERIGAFVWELLFALFNKQNPEPVDRTSFLHPTLKNFCKETSTKDV